MDETIWARPVVTRIDFHWMREQHQGSQADENLGLGPSLDAGQRRKCQMLNPSTMGSFGGDEADQHSTVW